MLIKDHLSLSYFIDNLFNHLIKQDIPDSSRDVPDYQAIKDIIQNSRLDKILPNKSIDTPLNIFFTTTVDCSQKPKSIFVHNNYLGKIIALDVRFGDPNYIYIEGHNKKLFPFLKEFIGTEYIMYPEKSQDYEYMTDEELERFLLKLHPRRYLLLSMDSY